MAGRIWNRDELLVALHVYCSLPFGQLHSRNERVREAAKHLSRTPSAVAMKACNFASFDSELRARGVQGLSNAGQATEKLWQEFENDFEMISAEAEEAALGIFKLGDATDRRIDVESKLKPEFQGKRTETTALRTIRLAQQFFRRTVLASYNERCAISGLAVPQLLRASHIIPWSRDARQRADPSNGICLNALHDAAFDRGFITFDEDFRTVMSRDLRNDEALGVAANFFTPFHGVQALRPERFSISDNSLEYHRQNIFRG